MLPVAQTFVLNLDRRPERWAKTNERLARHGIVAQRFPAVDGGTTEFQKLYWTDELRSRFKSPGALACLLSHIRLLECAQLRGYERIAIFEDDVRPHVALAGKLQRVHWPENWQAIYLGATQMRWTGVRAGPPGFYRPERTMGTWAMLVDRRAYPRMLAAYRRFQKTADLTLADLFSDDQDVYVASPNLCICDVESSDIRTPLCLATIAHGCRWELTEYDE